MCFAKLIHGPIQIKITSVDGFLPSFAVGGARVVVALAGGVPSGGTVDVGNGQDIACRAGVDTVGLIRTSGKKSVTVRDKKGKVLSEINYIVKPVFPVVEPPFIVGQLQLLNGVLVDTNKQVHGCEGGGEGLDKFGIWTQPFEKLQVKITANFGAIHCYGIQNGPFAAKWYIGHKEPPPIPDDKPVLTPQGLWNPGDKVGKPEPSCDAVSKHISIVIAATNQFGCETQLTVPLSYQQQGVPLLKGQCTVGRRSGCGPI